MPLTLRYNGNASANLINASWFNDFFNLFTGVMTDQEVTFANSLILKPIGGPPVYVTTALNAVAGLNMGIGNYTYVMTYLCADGESTQSSNAYATTTNGNQAMAITGIPTGPAGTTGRRIYRTQVGNAGTPTLVTTINDNTTTSYTDTASDASIASNPTPPTVSTFGGSLYIKDSTGATKLTIRNDGSFSGMKVLGTTSLDNGLITTDGNGNLTLPGTGKTYMGEAIFNTDGVTGLMWRHYSGGFITDASLFAETTGTFVIQSTAFGVKQQGGTKLMEVKSNGNMVISGTQYGTSAASVGTASGQTFDSFDVAEVYEFDAAYPGGTVVCPGPNNLLTRCAHDNCPCALIVSSNPGFLMGACDAQNNVAPIALTGRVNVATSAVITERMLVCSDGKGGVRPVTPGQPTYVLGFALNASLNNQVGLFLRPSVVTL